jgi:hypothetical protein
MGGRFIFIHFCLSKATKARDPNLSKAMPLMPLMLFAKSNLVVALEEGM